MPRLPRSSRLAFTALLLLGCDDDATGPRVSRVGDPCPALREAFSGFRGCVDIIGRVVDAHGRPVSSPEVQLALPGTGHFEERLSFEVAADSSGGFAGRWLIALPTGGNRDEVTLPVLVYYERAFPMHVSFREPSDSLALSATFVRGAETPYRYELTLRRTPSSQ